MLDFCDKYFMMKIQSVLTGIMIIAFLSCNDRSASKVDVQQIVDKSIEVAGGNLYTINNISFDFRDKSYELVYTEGQKTLHRIQKSDSAVIRDSKLPDSFQRSINDSLVVVVDSMARKYTNSLNSVHYFSTLPYGLNDPAVKKRFLGEITLNETEYYKVEITFNEAQGGEDFEDVFVYWFNKKTHNPDYLAYEFHVDGGGYRFREAYNERRIGGIRFVDYKNYKPKEPTSVYELDQLFAADKLEHLSNIELTNIKVIQGNYN